MESVRVCPNPNCRWEYPWTFKGTLCSFCKTDFNEQFCNTCQTWKPTTEFYKRTYPDGKTYCRKECKPCMKLRKAEHDKRNKQQKLDRDLRFWDRRREDIGKQYKAWVERISKLPFKTLSEQQWLDACSYLGGCAVCGDPHIETREYWVPFQEGGTYTAWNIYPMCGKCAIKSKLILNPFAKFDKHLGKSTGLAIDKIPRLIQYLELQIERAEKGEQKTNGV